MSILTKSFSFNIFLDFENFIIYLLSICMFPGSLNLNIGKTGGCNNSIFVRNANISFVPNKYIKKL